MNCDCIHACVCMRSFELFQNIQAIIMPYHNNEDQPIFEEVFAIVQKHCKHYAPKTGKGSTEESEQ